MQTTNCKICSCNVQVDARLSKCEKNECICSECLKSQCVFKGKSYNVNTHTASHCNSIRPPIYRYIGNKEICICYSHWNKYFKKQCVKCKTQRNVKECIDGMPYCENCKIDETKHCRYISNMLEDYVNRDVIQEIIKKIVV